MKMTLAHEGNNMREGYYSKFRQVHVDRSPRIDAVFPNLIEELRHFAPVPFAEEL
jgi:hypothetical protein